MASQRHRGPRGRVIVVGAGIFGVTAAIELRGRGWAVELIDPGPLPHPLAESTDISKIVRIDYGADEAYMALAERALEGWRTWDVGAERPLLHETGVAFLTRRAMAPGQFEHDSFELLLRRGHRPERLDAREIARRFPAFSTGVYVDGYAHSIGGWVEAGAAVSRLIERARSAGVAVSERCSASRLIDRGGRAVGVELASGGVLEGDAIAVCSGAWTAALLPELAASLRAVGQPVFHLRPRDPGPFAAGAFPVFGADIARTGYYGFPATRDGLVKIANHGVGLSLDPVAGAREVSDEQETALRSFLRDSLPALADAAIAHRRLCVYCDTADGHFWIAPDPARAGLTVAAGGSGHAFKFGPALGSLIADAVEGRPGPLAPRFGWRPGSTGRHEEAARHLVDRG